MKTLKNTILNGENPEIKDMSKNLYAIHYALNTNKIYKEDVDNLIESLSYTEKENFLNMLHNESNLSYRILSLNLDMFYSCERPEREITQRTLYNDHDIKKLSTTDKLIIDGKIEILNILLTHGYKLNNKQCALVSILFFKINSRLIIREDLFNTQQLLKHLSLYPCAYKKAFLSSVIKINDNIISSFEAKKSNLLYNSNDFSEIYETKPNSKFIGFSNLLDSFCADIQFDFNDFLHYVNFKDDSLFINELQNYFMEKYCNELTKMCRIEDLYERTLLAEIEDFYDKKFINQHHEVIYNEILLLSLFDKYKEVKSFNYESLEEKIYRRLDDGFFYEERKQQCIAQLNNLFLKRIMINITLPSSEKARL